MGLLDIFKKGLTNTRNFFAGGFTKIAASTGHFDEDMLDELEELMIRADCGVPASEDIITRVKEDIKKTGDDSHEAVLGSVRKRMTEILGEKSVLEIVPGKLNIILMIGVNGTGKTTTSGKLALRWKNEGKKVIMGAADTFRAAAVDQLKAWGEKTGTTVISQGSDGADPAAVVYDSVHAALSRKADILIVDTAGRLHNKKNLMDELAKIRRIIAREAPDAEVKALLIIDATTGQNAVIQAESFGEVTGIDYVGITKLDGSAKGGVAIAVAYQSGKPIVLAGLGEGAEDLVDFDPEIFVDSLLES
ncbi:MAG: signal recognition particle-docking protein FtsY [Clostridiales bacterium]|jgi:fused signal recognition particle receptor|nr:signal recognition particle-docking protein FtsY [Clostridiales bacterium]